MSLNSLGTSSIDVRDNCYYIVVEDEQHPILSDRSCFAAVTYMLRQHLRIIWLSPSEPLPMHQITGVARTAHAENDHLQLITIHTASTLLGQDRVFRVINDCLNRGFPEGPRTDWEREYRITSDGTVLIPRIRPSERLNCAVRVDGDLPETEMLRFIDSKRPLVLSLPEDDDIAAKPLFIEDEDAETTPLKVHEVEIETEAFILSKTCLATGLGEYSGKITRVREAVKGLLPGDRVVALGSSIGASRPRISHKPHKFFIFVAYTCPVATNGNYIDPRRFKCGWESHNCSCTSNRGSCHDHNL